MRLNRYLAACGLGSRRRCEELITSGRVRLNGQPAALADRIGPEDCVTVDGARVRPQETGAMWMLHKPAGVVCTADDPERRPTVLELAQSHGIRLRVFPVGRLDRDTTGLLLLTNDGALAFRLTHPTWGIEKEYEATVAAPLGAEELEHLRGGVQLADGLTSPCTVTQEVDGAEVRVRLVLHEGRKRQVRRMLEALGHPVLQLHRVRVGPLRLGDLPPGALRALVAAEKAALAAATAPADPTRAQREPA